MENVLTAEEIEKLLEEDIEEELPIKEIRKPVPEDLLKYVIELDPEEVERR